MLSLARSLIIAIYAFCLVLPVAIFFNNRGSIDYLASGSLSSTLQLIFPLFGLIAFSLVTMQVLIATNRWWLTRLWPRVVLFHRFQGSFALLFAIIHPLFVLLGYGVIKTLTLQEVAPDLRVYLIPAIIGFTILIGTVTTAFLAWQGRNISFWYKLHRLNYVVFALIWIHSWFIGSDVQTSALKYVWLGYLILVGASIFGKYSLPHSVASDK